MQNFRRWIRTHDAAHAWIPFVFMVFIAVLFLIFGNEKSLFGFTIRQILLSSSLLLLTLQAVNEWLQARDPKRDDKYGNRDNFRRNSKKDWAYFFGGLFSGTVLFILLTKLV